MSDTGGGAAGPDRDLLRAARRERGWSQGTAARELAALAARSGGPSATAGSLKTQLSRWENGHATPDPQHRALLAALYRRDESELGLAPPRSAQGSAGPDATDRFRAAVEATAALDGETVALLHEQVRATAALDHRLGTIAAHPVLSAQVERLRSLHTHTVDPTIRTALAAALADAALLAGDQERDLDAPERAWQAYLTAEDTARRSGRQDVRAAARARRVRLLRETGLEAAARTLADLGEPGRTEPGGTGQGSSEQGGAGRAADRQVPPVPATVSIDHPGPPVRDRLEDLVAEAEDARREGRTAEADAAATTARRLALRTGSVRTLTVLDRQARR